MKTLLLTPSIALAFGAAGTAIAETPATITSDVSFKAEVMTYKTASLVEMNDFYQGDFASITKANEKHITHEDLYRGLGASEGPAHRFVTDF